MKQILLLLPLGLFFLTGCNNSSGNAELRAKAMCDCFEDIIDISSLNAINIEDKFEEAMRDNSKQDKYGKCVLSVIEEISKDLDNLKQDEKKEYTKSLLKAGIDCECADKLMDIIPYDLLKVAIPKMKRDIEKSAEYRRKRESEASDYYSEANTESPAAASYDGSNLEYEYRDNTDEAIEQLEAAVAAADAAEAAIDEY
jgi:hypothetical protein